LSAWAAIRRLSAWDWVHRWSSLVCTLFLLLLCVTGLPLIFRHEIDAALHVKLKPGAWDDARPAASADRALSAAEARFPDGIPLFMSHDRHAPEIWYVTLRSGQGDDLKQAAVDARSAEPLGDVHVGDEGVMGIIDSLHVDLFMGLKGKLFLGVMGFLFLISLVSGAVLYGPFLRGRRFGAVRSGRGPKSRWLDLHNLLGIATLLWCLVVGVTGVINTCSELLLGTWRSRVLSQLETAPVAVPIAGLQAAIDAAMPRLPGMEIAFIAFPGASFSSPSHYGVYFRGREPLTERLVRPVFVDANSGRVSAVPGVPWYLTALFLSEPLHFGDYGGLPLKILWALFDAVALVVLGSGMYLWLRK
jgi:uncharacterized iron-regulated membrane protein